MSPNTSIFQPQVPGKLWTKLLQLKAVLRRYARIWIGPVFVLALWGALFLSYVLAQHSFSFIGFMSSWGGVIGILATVVVTVMVALVPSEVEQQVQVLSELVRKRLPGPSFQAVRAVTLTLLNEVSTDPRSHFRMAAACPILGIELSEDERNEFLRKLKDRIQAGYETTVICLDPGGSNEKPRESPLWKFCDELAKYMGNEDRALEFLEIAIASIEDVSQMESKFSSKLSLRVVRDFPVGAIVATSSTGTRKGILYFSSPPLLAGKREGIQRAIFTQDQTLLDVADALIEGLYGRSERWTGDLRTEVQRWRDQQLAKSYSSREQEVELAGFGILVMPEVFPPHIGLGSSQLAVVIPQIADEIFASTPAERRVGIDVGSGTGYLALVLARKCRKVYAVDIDEIAVRNTRANFTKNQGQIRHVETKVFEGSLFVPIVSQHLVNRSDVCLVVFNQPYYPSRLDLYHTGGSDAGSPIIREFLNQVRSLTCHNFVIVMPYSEISRTEKDDHDPGRIAKEMGFSVTVLVEWPWSAGNRVYHDRIYRIEL